MLQSYVKITMNSHVNYFTVSYGRNHKCVGLVAYRFFGSYDCPEPINSFAPAQPSAPPDKFMSIHDISVLVDEIKLTKKGNHLNPAPFLIA